MKSELVELSERLQGARDLDQFWNIAREELRGYGASSMLYGALASRFELEAGHLTRSVIWKGSHGQAYVDAFGKETFADDDLTAQQCVGGRDPIIWHDDSNWEDAPQEVRKRQHMDRDLGLHVGFSVPSGHFHGSHVGGIGVAMRDVKPEEFDRIWQSHGDHLISVCGLIDTGMRKQHMSRLIRLSPREREVLCWLVAGLRPPQIADRLGIGSTSIDKYIQSAKRKLKARTRDQAVAKALLFNLIRP